MDNRQWDNLSVKEKSEMMKVAIRNGITNLADIKAKYNEFALGGDLQETDVNLFDGSKSSKINKRKSSSNRFVASPNTQYAMQYFINKGFAPHQAAGIVGNLMRESGVNPTAINPSSKAFGLAQWLGARKKKLFSMYGNSPTLQNQLDFLWWEMNNTHKNGKKYIMAAKDPRQAAEAMGNYVEFANGNMIAEMNKWGQDGAGSMRKGIENAYKLMNQPIPKYDMASMSTQEFPVQYSQSPEAYSPYSNQQAFDFTPSRPDIFFNDSNYQDGAELYARLLGQGDPVSNDELLAMQQAAERKRQREKDNSTLQFALGMMNSSKDKSGEGFYNALLGLAMGNQSAYGGNLFDGGGHFFPVIGDTWRNTQSGRTGKVVGFTTRKDIDENGNLVDVKEPVIQYEGDDTYYAGLQTEQLPEVEVKGHLNYPAKNMEMQLLEPYKGFNAIAPSQQFGAIVDFKETKTILTVFIVVIVAFLLISLQMSILI